MQINGENEIIPFTEGNRREYSLLLYQYPKDQSLNVLRKNKVLVPDSFYDF